MKVIYKPLVVRLSIPNGEKFNHYDITLPDWTKFVAINENGLVKAYTHKPSQCIDEWNLNGKTQMFKVIELADFDRKIPKWKQYCIAIDTNHVEGVNYNGFITVESETEITEH